MLKSTSYDDVTRFDLARTILGRGRYWTTAYLVDDLLIDSGCAYAAPELEAAFAQLELARQAADAGPVSELQAAVEANPDDLQARFDLAQALHAHGDVEQAVAEKRKVRMQALAEHAD